jgi:protein-S-isoprenylcysteine O-methyltransferase Ste14
MDEAAKSDLRFRFIKLIVLLNAILILTAVAVLLSFWMPTPTGRVAMVVFLAAAAGLFLYFKRLYHQTKQWLDAEHRKGTAEPHGNAGNAAGAVGERTD